MPPTVLNLDIFLIHAALTTSICHHLQQTDRNYESLQEIV